MAKATKKATPVIEEDKVSAPVEKTAKELEAPFLVPQELVDESIKKSKEDSEKSEDEKKTESPLSSTPVSTIDKVLEEENKVRVEKVSDTPKGELTNEEKIVQYVEKASGNMVKLNDFLKSLYPAPAYNEPPLWKQQIVSRQIRLMLSKMHNNGSIKIVNNIHSMLGDCYFDAEGKAKHYDLDSLSVSVEK